MALVGPSGGGKSTLASLICRFFDVGSGSICVGGADVRDIPKEELMDTVSFVFQNSRLLKASASWTTSSWAGPTPRRQRRFAALRAAQCMDIIEKFPDGIDTVIGSKGVYLSGGEQQRIAIARAMLKNAPILILDEATAFADPDNEAKVQAAFAELAKGKTVIMIAHRLSTVVNADCIYVVQDGRIAEAGTKGDLCARNGLFAKMWQDYQSSVRWKVEKEGPSMLKKIQRATASSPEGTRGLVRGVLACAAQNIAFMLPDEPAVCARPRPDGGRRSGKDRILCLRLRCLLCPDPSDDVVPV